VASGRQVALNLTVALVSVALLLLAGGREVLGQQRTRQTKGWDFTEKIQCQGNVRTFIVHIPPSYNPTTPIPVVLVFHGAYMNGQMMLYVTGFNKVADRHKFVVLYPDGLGGRWEDGRFAHAGGDIEFVSDMLNQLSRRVKIDQRRIYAAGLSNGGYFVQKLACETNRIAAIAVVASALAVQTANACQNSRAVPVMFFVGSADPLVPSNDPDHNAELGKIGEALGIGSLGSLSPSIAQMGGMMTSEEAVAFWCHHNHCSLSPYTKQLPDLDPRDGTRVKCETYGGYGSEVVLYKIEGGGHNWPGAVYFGPKEYFGNLTHDIDASELIADFFLHHSN
jgi:polyhydroxybutyrate depolymerase